MESIFKWFTFPSFFESNIMPAVGCPDDLTDHEDVVGPVREHDHHLAANCTINGGVKHHQEKVQGNQCPVDGIRHWVVTPLKKEMFRSFKNMVITLVPTKFQTRQQSLYLKPEWRVGKLFTGK